MMGWFWQKKSDDHETRDATTPPPATIEIVADKEAKADVIQEAREANRRLKKLLTGNDRYTITIYLAAGGELPNTVRQRKHT